MRQCPDKVIQAYGFTCCLYLLFRNILCIVHQVFSDCALKKPCVLKHHAELGTYFFTLHIPGRNTVDLDIAALDLMETHQQIHQCRLAGTCRTDNRDLLSRFCLG